MNERVMMASKFKEQCLSVLDQVARTKVPVTVTKHGRAVARVVPMEERAHRSTDRSVTLLAEEDELYFATAELWEADRPPS
jgi:prevent-host-death family protein